MKGEDFRNLALSLPEAAESSHFGAADFRVRGRIFAQPAGKPGRAVLIGSNGGFGLTLACRNVLAIGRS